MDSNAVYTISNIAEAGHLVTELKADVAEENRLEQAVALFDQLSEQLSDSYQSLESQVKDLTGELNQVRAKRALEAKEKQRVSHRLESLLNILPGGVVVLDHTGKVRQCNPAAIDLLGEPLLGAAWLDVISRSFAPRVDDGHEISLHDGRRVSIATRSLEDGNAPGQLILLTDLTQTRELQAQLSRQDRLSAVGQMVSSLAHQVRTPLSAAMLYAGHLSEPDLSPQQLYKFADKVQSRLEHLDKIVNDMLMFVRGDVKLSECVRVSDLVIQLKKQAEPLLARYDATLTVFHQGDDAQIQCNRDTIVSAFINLVDNALQACGKGACLELKTSTLNNNVAMFIEDNGPGMDAETLMRVKEAFYTTKAQGTGLGLAVAGVVAKAHQGSFEIRSEPGLGTCAGMVLPALAKQELI